MRACNIEQANIIGTSRYPGQQGVSAKAARAPRRFPALWLCLGLVGISLPAIVLTTVLAALFSVATPSAAYADDDDDDGSSSGSTGAESRGNSSPLQALQQKRKRVESRKPRSRAERRQPRRAEKPRRERPRQERRAPAPTQRIAPEFVVLVDIGSRTDALREGGFEILERSGAGFIGQDVLRLRSTRTESRARALDRLRQIIPGADLNTIYRTSEFRCSAQDCPAFDTIGWPKPPQTCKATPLIGVIDTAVDANHPAFAAGAVLAHSVRSDGQRPSSNRHGTAIAAIIAGQQGENHAGLLPRARIIAVDAFHRQAGEDIADSFAIVQALEYLMSNRVPIINMSIAGPENTVLETAIEAALHQGIILVAAAGNGGAKAKPAFPAAYDGVVAVTAIDHQDKLFRRANRGDYVDIAAPGVNIQTVSHGKKLQSGTSFAVPFVTAMLAVGPGHASAAALESQLLATARDLGPAGRDQQFGLGILTANGICNLDH